MKFFQYTATYINYISNTFNQLNANKLPYFTNQWLSTVFHLKWNSQNIITYTVSSSFIKSGTRLIFSANWVGNYDVKILSSVQILLVVLKTDWKNVARDGSVPNITCAWLYPALGQRINREGGGGGRSGGGGRLWTKGATRTFPPAPARGCNARPNINNIAQSWSVSKPGLVDLSAYMWASGLAGWLAGWQGHSRPWPLG